MHVKFVRQGLKRHSIMQWPLRLERPGLVDDSLRRGPSACVPGAECFERDPKSCRALCLGQAEQRADLPQGRDVLGHGHDDAISSHCLKANGLR
jgi:hypothetical protein